jgi:hypothetical protein
MNMKISALVAFLWAAASTQCCAATGASSSDPPYLIPAKPGVEFTSILTAGDAVASRQGEGVYRKVGIPDGLGAYDNGDGSITVLMNHELSRGSGAVRMHGSKGAFVSRWQVRKRDLVVLDGQDLIKTVNLWNADRQTYVKGAATGFSRFCSADLAAPTAFFNRKTGKGFGEGRIFMNGEEDAFVASRGFAHVVTGSQQGTSYELPKFGHHPFENLLASPYEQDKTIVAANEDGGAKKVYFYIGEKQAKGNPVEMAGLSDGRTYELKIEGYAGDDPDTGFKSGRFSLVAEGGTTLSRPEDGAWDTADPNRYYFVTTANYKGNSRLWVVVFHDIRQPERGGTIRVLLDGAAAGVKMMDNITVDLDGNIYIQEDVGNNPHLGRVWMFDPHTRALTNLARHDPPRFLEGSAGFITQDEESSGIIEVSDLFKGVKGYDTARNRYFLLDVQAHYPIGGEIVEGGQLLLMKVAK